MALRKPSDLFNKKETSGVFESPEVSSHIAESYDKFRNNFDKVNELSEKVEVLSKELSEKLTKSDLENAMLSQLMILDENFKTLQNQVKGLNKQDLKEFKETVSNLSEIVDNLVETELPKYKKQITKNKLYVGEQINQLQEVIDSNALEIREEIDIKISNLSNNRDENFEEYTGLIENLSSLFQDFSSVFNEEILDIKANIVINEQHFKNVDRYIREHHQELIELKEEVFAEIEKLSVGNLQENIERLESKIDYIKETYSKIEPEVVVKEVIKEGLLNEPPETDNSDPLTPFDKNFVTLDQLQEHYRLFINRIQQQLATMGGGGETKLKYLDDIVGIATNASAYDGKFLKYTHSLGKFEFATVSGGGGGSSDYASVAGIATTATTVDIMNTNGLTTVYYPTFVEDRTDGQIVRADVDLTYRTDDNTLTVPNVSATTFTGALTGNATGLSGSPNIVVGIVTSDISIPTQLRTRSVAEKTTLVSGNTVGLAFTAGGGNVAICTNPSGDITLNVTSIPTDSSFDNHSISFSVIVTQTGTARTCTAVNLNGVSRTIRWVGGSLSNAISGVTTSSGYDIFTFTGINTVGSASTTANYVILGSVNGGFN